MKHKRLAIAIIATMISIQASAQWKAGLQAGYTYNRLTASASYAYDRNLVPGHGFTVGIPVQYEFYDWFSIEADFAYIQKNYSMLRSAQFADTYYNTSNSYLQIPVMAHFSFGGKRLRGFFNAGAYMGFWASSRIQGRQNQYFYQPEWPQSDMAPYHFNEKVPFDSRRDNRFEGGLSAGAGIKYIISPTVAIVVEARYNYGLTDIQKEYMNKQFHRYNNTLSLQAGCMFTFGNK